MILTSRILDKAPLNVRDFCYGNPTEEIITQNCPKEVLMWLRDYVDISEEENARVNYLLNLKGNVEPIFNCFDVSESENIYNSHEVKKSISVFNSHKIENSARIRSSSMVNNSEDIHSGFLIRDSLRVYDSKNISNSANVVFSNFIVGSRNVLSGKTVEDCSEIARCSDCNNVHFSSDCKNLKNSLFCSNIENDEWLVFNKPVSENIFKLIIAQYEDLVCHEMKFIPWNDKTIIQNLSQIKVSFRPDVYCVDNTQYFWEWVKTLPGFDKDIFYFLTFKKDFQ